MAFNRIVSAQRDFFNTDATKSITFRLEQLIKLKGVILENQEEIYQALFADLHKSKTEADVTEVGLILKEIDIAIANLKLWSKPKSVSTPFALWTGQSNVYYEPYGVTLIISPWNFPFLITFQPLIGAIAAGNCVIIKPSEIAVNSEKLITRLINDNFNEKHIHVINADAHETQTLLQEKFDYIFFTGSVRVGKIVNAAAAPHLTPVTLELGGKNPCIVDETADIKSAARHIMWGKTLNAGQVCIAPDYLYVHSDVKDLLVKEMMLALQEFYGDNPKTSLDFGRIINAVHFQRLKKLLENGSILIGGDADESEKYIAPTLIENVTWQDAIMQEEIFGPLLPIFTYQSLDDVISQIKSQQKSLALYIFTSDTDHKEKILRSISFGNGAVNTCVLQIANANLPFGGVGESGMGNYHGRYSFETFSHKKGIYERGSLIDINPQYPPHTPEKRWLIKKIF